MLETYQLKQEYNRVRQELSNSLYQYDAACRVIARLMKERDEARQALVNVQLQAGTAAQPTEETAMEVDEAAGAAEGLAQKYMEVMMEKAAEYVLYFSPFTRSNRITANPRIQTLHRLSKTRKKRKPDPTTATPEQVSAYKQLSTMSLPTKATSMDLDARKDLVVAGHQNGAITVSSVQSGKVGVTLSKSHSKKVTKVAFNPQTSNRFFSGGQVGVVKCWEYDYDSGSADCKFEVKAHDAEVSAISVSPTGRFTVSSGLDSTWSFLDVDAGKIVMKYTGEEDKKSYSTASFHPDGLIFAAGTSNGSIRIFDFKSQSPAATFEGHAGAVTGIAFSENGYHLATVSAGAKVVKLWDLRKLSNFENIDLSSYGGSAKGCSAVAYDYSSLFLASAIGNEVCIHQHKTYQQLFHGAIVPKSAELVGVKFGKDARYLVGVGSDGSLVTYGV